MPFENNVIGNSRKCDAVEQGINSILNSAESADLGRMMVLDGKMSIPPYGTIDFKDFEDYQWEESFGLNIGWGWKANALVFVKYLLAYHHSSGDDAALNLVKAGIVSWLDKYMETDESYPYRFIWHDMGTGMRLENMITFLAYIHQFAPIWRESQMPLRETILRACFRHAVLLTKDSFYTANTNHGMHQMCQLLLAGAFFDGAAMEPADAACLAGLTDDPAGAANSWRSLAGERLDRELKFCFTDEGVHVENSPAYHSFVFRTFMALVREYPPDILGESLAAILSRLSQDALEYLARILRPDKYLPIIGDTELLPVTDAFQVFGGTPAYGWFTYARTGGERGAKPEAVNKVYPKSGYAIFRDKWGGKGDYDQALHLVVKAGCLSRYHHQQDEGNVVLYAFGEDWLIDSGLYSHAPKDPVRMYMRSRAAHNVPLIFPDAPYSQEFEHRLNNWEITGYDESDEQPFVKMRLDVLENVHHERLVAYQRAADQIEVEDSFECLDGRERNIAILWHVPADKEIIVEPGLIKIKSPRGRQIILNVQSAANFTASVAKGCVKDIIRSCVSPKFGVVEDSQVIRINFDPAKSLSVACRFTLASKPLYVVNAPGGGAPVKLELPIKWTMNPYQLKTWQHHFMSLRWINADMDVSSLFNLLKDFYFFHVAKKVKNSFYNTLQGDHAMAIRLKFFTGLVKKFEKSEDQKEIDLVNLTNRLIRQELINLQTPANYRRGHNHALMADVSLLVCYVQLERFRPLINLDLIIDRALDTLRTMFDFNTGVTREHSVAYQIYNQDIFKELLRLLNHEEFRGRADLESINNIYSLVSEATGRLVAMSVRSDGSCFPLGDSNRKPNDRLLSSLLGDDYQAEAAVFRKEKVMLCEKEGFAFYRSPDGHVSNLDLAFVCGWHSHNHKQNDELSFCLDYRGVNFFDDAGYLERISMEQLEVLQSEHAHSTITIDGRPWGPKTGPVHEGEISGRLSGASCFFEGSHYRVEGKKISRAISLSGDQVLIVDSVDKSLGEATRHRFLLGDGVDFEKVSDSLVLLSKAGLKAALECRAKGCNIEIGQVQAVDPDNNSLQTRTSVDFHINTDGEERGRFLINFGDGPFLDLGDLESLNQAPEGQCTAAD